MKQEVSENVELTYEVARDELMEIVAKLEAGEVSLDVALKLWERGDKLAKFCQTYLHQARKKLESGTNVANNVEDVG